MRILDLGTTSYTQACEQQMHWHEQVRAGGQEVVLLTEHLPVITLGRKGGSEYLHSTQEMLAKEGIDLVQTKRGGNITCHFPGQLVGYPIVRIARRPGGLRHFFHQMEQVLVDTLAAFAVQGRRVEGRPGVWVGEKKIASMGIAVRRWVSYHGFALNVGPDMSLFDRITPCGLPGVRPTSLHDECQNTHPVPPTPPKPPAMQEVKDVLATHCLQTLTHP